MTYLLDEPKTSKKKKKKRGKKGRGGDSDDETKVSRPEVKVGEGEMPDGALSSGDEKEKKKVKEVGPRDSVMDALDQNLDM